MARKKKEFRVSKEVKAIARERVGPPPPARAIVPKDARRKPKHKKPIDPAGEAEA
jgi:hypothetical protein